MSDAAQGSAFARAAAFIRRRGARDILWSLTGSTGQMAIGVATTMLLARLLGPSGYGVLSLALAIAFTVAGLADWGLSIAFVRLGSPEVMAGRSIRHLHTIFLALRLALAGAVALAVLLAGDRLFPALRLPGDLPWLAPLAVLAGIAFAAGGHYTAVLQVVRDQRGLAFVRLGAAAARFLAYAGWAILATRQLAIPLLIALLAVLAEAAATGWLAHRRAELWPPVHQRPPAPWLAFSLWAAVPAITYSLIGQTDTVLLAALAGTAETGIWAAVGRISSVLLIGSGAAWSVALPYVTALHDRPAVLRYLRLVGVWTLGLAVVTAVAVLLAPLMVRILYGDAYLRGTGALRLLLAGHAMGSALLLLIPVAYRLGRERLVAVAGMAEFAVNLVGDIVLIPRSGAAGSALATVLMYAAAVAVLVPPLFRELARGGDLPPAAATAAPEPTA